MHEWISSSGLAYSNIVDEMCKQLHAIFRDSTASCGLALLLGNSCNDGLNCNWLHEEPLSLIAKGKLCSHAGVQMKQWVIGHSGPAFASHNVNKL